MVNTLNLSDILGYEAGCSDGNVGCRMEKEAGPCRGQHADVTCWHPHQSSQLPLATEQSPLQCPMNPLLPRGRPHPLLLPLPGTSTAPLPWFRAHLCPLRRQPGLMLEQRATGPQLSLSFPPRVTSVHAVPGRCVGSQGTHSPRPPWHAEDMSTCKPTQPFGRTPEQRRTGPEHPACPAGQGQSRAKDC